MTLLADSHHPAAAEQVGVREQLQARIRQMQSSRLPERSFPLLEEVRPLLPNGLRAGAVYSVTGSTSLALALIAGASQGGAWCGALGVPHLGTEAASEAGIRLDRFVLVPDAGSRWGAVAAAMADVLGLIIAAPGQVSPTEAGRLAARLRQRESSLIVLGPWPQADAALHARETRWGGLGQGHGALTRRQLRVETVSRGGRPRSRTITLPTVTTSPHLREGITDAVLSDAGPSGVGPSGAVPSGARPSGAVPSGAVPSGAVPSTSVPAGGLPPLRLAPDLAG